ncbi:hypothetical protein [Streptomyces caniferus]|uniref:hypothetical protein n=1 Tax=Streptomyces caniferus TaxID=285557 RepID=UPI00381DBC3F
MATTVPTADDVQALSDFMLQRAGEERRSHPDYLPVRENAQRARIRQQLEG